MEHLGLSCLSHCQPATAAHGPVTVGARFSWYRNMVVGCCVIACMGVCLAPAWGQAPPKYEKADLRGLQEYFEKLAQELRPGVVAIQSYMVKEPANNPNHQMQIRISQGSGLVIGSDGHIATNRHVLEDANLFMVTLHDGARYAAEVVQTDPRSDLAVLKIDAKDLKPVRWGDASKVKVGHWTVAVGNPYGRANDDGNLSVSFGTISALGREMTHRLSVNPMVQYYGHLIETTAAINPGNSGGPLFNLDGEVIGIVTAIETASGANEGSGFAIPVDEPVRRALETLQSGQEVRYGYLGVTVEDVPPPMSQRVADRAVHRGARITSVNPADGPAGKADLAPGDVVLEFNGQPIEDADHLVRTVGFAPVGAEAEVVYLRQGVKRKAAVLLMDRQEALQLVK